ncbi:unnamed protein product [Mytilus edulis]|uniref:LRRNT domain-containing protein n=1 Tax=Mytilus edulis TaxID=6550 RepID=A0A8S3QSK8_MYTED|nr:unnamed protein product [Mytilus edulis]
MLYTVEFMLMFSLSTIHLARAQGCPNMCTCSGTTVDCSNKGLTQIPDDIPSTTTTLFLYGNSITSIEENGFNGLTSLQELYFNNNPLVCCSVTGFVDWVNRRSLDLFEGTCTAHNKTTAILNFNTSDCIVPVDGGWSDWENSTCSVTCGDGTVTMIREFDGGWSDWENSTCSVTCGDGTVNMNRECNNPVPSGGGHNCSGESIDTDSCNLGVCPESCSTLEKELDKKSGKRSDNKSGKWSDNKSGKWSDNKSGGKRNGRNGKKEKRQNKKGNKPNRNGWY